MNGIRGSPDPTTRRPLNEEESSTFQSPPILVRERTHRRPIRGINKPMSCTQLNIVSPKLSSRAPMMPSMAPDMDSDHQSSQQSIQINPIRNRRRRPSRMMIHSTNNLPTFSIGKKLVPRRVESSTKDLVIPIFDMQKTTKKIESSQDTINKPPGQSMDGFDERRSKNSSFHSRASRASKASRYSKRSKISRFSDQISHQISRLGSANPFIQRDSPFDHKHEPVEADKSPLPPLPPVVVPDLEIVEEEQDGEGKMDKTMTLKERRPSEIKTETPPLKGKNTINKFTPGNAKEPSKQLSKYSNMLQMISSATSSEEVAPAMHWQERKKTQIQMLISKDIRQQSRVCRWITKHLIISTTSMGYQLWKIGNIIVSLASSFMYVFMAAFYHQMDDSTREQLSYVDRGLDIFFFLALLLTFFVEVHYPNSHEVEREMPKIIAIYLKGRFLQDLITVLPLATWLGQAVPVQFNKLFYLLKLFRLRSGLQLLDYKIFLKEVKQLIHNRLHRLVEEHPERAACQLEDQTHITKVLNFKYFLKVLQLVIILFFFSYLCGLLWYIQSELSLFIEFPDFASSSLHSFYQSLFGCPEFRSEDNFITNFGINDLSPEDSAILASYFMFTSLSTVGLGDLHPRSNQERILACFILLVGVNLTSFITDYLSAMIVQQREVSQDHSETKQLSLFLATIVKFNDNCGLDREFLDRIDKYFNYKWANDRNLVISSPDDQFLYSQLPKEIQRSIYFDFLFRNFIQTYHQCLIFHNKVTPYSLHNVLKRIHLKLTPTLQNQYRKSQLQITWEGEAYQDFVLLLLQMLEPKHIESKQVIIRHNEQVNEALFMVTGKVLVGYNYDRFLREQDGIVDSDQSYETLKSNALSAASAAPGAFVSTEKGQNRHHFPVVLQHGRLAVGLMEMLCGLKSSFIYKANKFSRTLLSSLSSDSYFDCFFIRKRRWQEIEASTDPELIEGFKTRVFLNYLERIYIPIREFQSEVLDKEDRIRQDSFDAKISVAEKGEKALSQSSASRPAPPLRGEESISVVERAFISQISMVKRESTQILLNDIFQEDPTVSLFFTLLKYKQDKFEEFILAKPDESAELRPEKAKAVVATKMDAFSTTFVDLLYHYHKVLDELRIERHKVRELEQQLKQFKETYLSSRGEEKFSVSVAERIDYNSIVGSKHGQHTPKAYKINKDNVQVIGGELSPLEFNESLSGSDRIVNDRAVSPAPIMGEFGEIPEVNSVSSVSRSRTNTNLSRTNSRPSSKAHSPAPPKQDLLSSFKPQDPPPPVTISQAPEPKKESKGRYQNDLTSMNSSTSVIRLSSESHVTEKEKVQPPPPKKHLMDNWGGVILEQRTLEDMESMKTDIKNSETLKLLGNLSHQMSIAQHTDHESHHMEDLSQYNGSRSLRVMQPHMKRSSNPLLVIEEEENEMGGEHMNLEDRLSGKSSSEEAGSPMNSDVRRNQSGMSKGVDSNQSSSKKSSFLKPNLSKKQGLSYSQMVKNVTRRKQQSQNALAGFQHLLDNPNRITKHTPQDMSLGPESEKDHVEPKRLHLHQPDNKFKSITPQDVHTPITIPDQSPGLRASIRMLANSNSIPEEIDEEITGQSQSREQSSVIHTEISNNGAETRKTRHSGRATLFH